MCIVNLALCVFNFYHVFNISLFAHACARWVGWRSSVSIGNGRHNAATQCACALPPRFGVPCTTRKMHRLPWWFCLVVSAVSAQSGEVLHTVSSCAAASHLSQRRFQLGFMGIYLSAVCSSIVQ